MNILNALPYICLEMLFPAGCCLCASMLTETEEILNGVCKDCAGQIKLESENRCQICGKPLISEINICLGCRTNFNINNTDQTASEPVMPSYDRLFSLFPYTGVYQELLLAYKYGKSSGAARFWTDKLLEALEMLKIDSAVLVPVPPRQGKIFKTGWDQIDFLSKFIKKRKKYPVKHCLLRLPGETQKKLNRNERLVNLSGKIRFKNIAKNHVPPVCIVFDDVITTGSTMGACASALKEAGARKVYGISLVYG